MSRSAKPTDTHLASIVHCVDGEIVAWLERREAFRLGRIFDRGSTTDAATVYAAAGPVLRRELRHDGATVTCPALDTRYPAAA
jgi:hypothetical protein